MLMPMTRECGQDGSVFWIVPEIKGNVFNLFVRNLNKEQAILGKSK